MDNVKLDIEKIEQKLKKIKRRNRNDIYYNYKNIDLLPTIHENDVILPPSPPEISKLSFSISSPEIDSYNRDSFHSNSIMDNTKPKTDSKSIPEKKNVLDTISHYYHYFFPIKEGVTNPVQPQKLDLDPMNIKFWDLPCNFLNIDFYTNLIAGFIEAQADYSKDPNDKNYKNDKALIKSFIDQMIMILIAFIMTFNIYYFVFMYNWDCVHGTYVPGYGIYFGDGQISKLIQYIIRDVRIPVFYCSYIYTYAYPFLFDLLQVRKYKRLSFLFIFLFMLCFVFITGKSIGVSTHSFITSGKISLFVLIIVLVSVFLGIFFTDQSELDKQLQEGLQKICSKRGTISNTLEEFCIAENQARIKGEPYYYSIREKINDFQSQMDKYIGKDMPPHIQKLEIEIERLKVLAENIKNESNNKSLGGLNVPSIVNSLNANSNNNSSPGDKILTTLVNKYGTLAFGKLYTIILAIIRIVIACGCLPIAQIFISWFFLYTTSGVGLFLNEGFACFRRVIYHMNDNNGEVEDAGINPFYKSVNDTPFFKYWINELFLTTMYIIYTIVKICTIPFQLSKLEVKITSTILMAFIIFLYLWVFYDSYTNYYNVHLRIDNNSNNRANITNNDTNSSDILPPTQDSYPDNTDNMGFNENTLGKNPMNNMNNDSITKSDILPKIENMFSNGISSNGFDKTTMNVNPLRKMMENKLK